MSTLTQILGITGPVFTIIAIGFLAIRFELMPASSSKVLGSFAINFALPALLFKSISQQSIADIMQWNYPLAYASGSLLSFIIVFYISRNTKRLGNGESALYGMGSSFSNSLMLGFPITLQLFGDAALIPLALTLMVENFLMMPLTLTIAEVDNIEESNRITVFTNTLKRVLRNPIIIAIILGVIASAANITLPQPLSKVVGLFSQTVSGVALFAIGGLLAGSSLRSFYSQIAMVLPAKLLLHPLLVAMAVYLVPGIDPQTAMIAIVLASMPMFGVFPIIGARFGMGEQCAGVLIPTTITSFFSINMVLWLLNL